MEKINIVYDSDYKDTDIIAIPRELSGVIHDLANQHDIWLYDLWCKNELQNEDRDYWTIIDGKCIGNLETVGFVKWLNKYYCKGERKVIILKQHTNFIPDFRSIEW